jgi:hypothetical protein
VVYFVRGIPAGMLPIMLFIPWALVLWSRTLADSLLGHSRNRLLFKLNCCFISPRQFRSHPSIPGCRRSFQNIIVYLCRIMSSRAFFHGIRDNVRTHNRRKEQLSGMGTNYTFPEKEGRLRNWGLVMARLNKRH